MEKIVNMENVVNMIKGEDGCKSRLGLGWKWECFVALKIQPEAYREPAIAKH